MASLRQLYRNLKIRNKLILMFSLLVILSLTLLSIVSIALFERIVIKNENRAIMEGLDFFRSSLDEYLEHVENFSSSIIFSKDIQESMRLKLDSLSREDRLDHYNQIYRTLYESFNSTYGISAIFLANQYGNSFRVDTLAGNYTQDSWEIHNQRGWERAEERKGAPSWEIVENPWGQQGIGMFRTIHNMSNPYDRSDIGRSAIMISPAIMKSYFSKNRYSEGIYGIIDDSGTVYVSSNATVHDDMFILGEMSGSKSYYSKTLNGTNYLISFIRDSRTGWVFAYAIDSHIPLREVKYIRHVTVLIFAITILMVVGLSFMVSGSVTKPLREMVQQLKEMEKGKLSVRFQGLYEDEMGILGRSLNRMVEKIRQGIPLKREKYFRSLLMETITPDQQEQARKDMDIAFSGEAYQVVLLRARLEVDEDTNRQIETMISAHADSCQGVLSNTMRSGEYCIISSRSEKDTRDMIHRLVEQLREGSGVEVMAFSGKSYGSYHFVKHSYEEALELIRYQLYRTEPSEWLDWSFVDSNTWGSDYPEHLENRLMHAAQQGEVSDCRVILDETLDFFKEKSSKPTVMHAFVFIIYLQLYKSVMKRGHMPDALFGQSFFSSENLPFMMDSVETAFERLLGVIESFAALVADSEEKHISTSIRTTLEIIKNEYGNPDLGLEYVAGKVHLNENYIGKLFKKELGISFVEYVSSIRLERAKEMLSGSAIKIKDISAQVGFTNPNYFGIWFKENTGLTPSQFRNQLQ